MEDKSLIDWLICEAECLDISPSQAESLLGRIAAAGVLRAGVPLSEGGEGGTLSTAISAIADLAEHSLTAAFVCWAQRAVIECLLQSPNRSHARQCLPSLLEGSMAGAPGLSNAMKALNGIGEMQVQFLRGPAGFILNGNVPWATNVHKQGFLLVIAAYDSLSDTHSVFAVPHDTEGLSCGVELDLMALSASNTTSVFLNDAALDNGWQIHPNAKVFLPGLRPAFLGLQSGMGIGLARASLRAARANTPASHILLRKELDSLSYELEQCWNQLYRVADGMISTGTPRQLLEVRIGAVELAMRAVQLELQALGGKAYSSALGNGFARRWREVAFLPVLTPSLMHLKTELMRQPPLAADSGT